MKLIASELVVINHDRVWQRCLTLHLTFFPPISTQFRHKFICLYAIMNLSEVPVSIMANYPLRHITSLVISIAMLLESSSFSELNTLV